MLGKITGNKMILGAFAGIFGGLILAVVLVVILGVGSSAPPQAADAATTKTAAAPAAKSKATADPHAADQRFGPTYVIKDQIVNLADPGGRRYLRYSVAIEFAEHAEETASAPSRGEATYQLTSYVPEDDEATYQPVTGGASKDSQKEFEARIKKYVPAIQDVVTTVLSSKTYADIATVDGKEHAKAEIKDRVQRILGDAEHVTNVYFTEFVVQ